jgi:hypothetical protein
MKAMKAIILGLFLVAVFAMVAVAEDVSPIGGSWQVTIKTESGTLTGVAELTVDENHITGTFKTDAGKFRVDGVSSSDKIRIYVFNPDGDGLILAGSRDPGVIKGSATTMEGVAVGELSAQRN